MASVAVVLGEKESIKARSDFCIQLLMALYPEYEWIAYLAGAWMVSSPLALNVWLWMLLHYPKQVPVKWGGEKINN